MRASTIGWDLLLDFFLNVLWRELRKNDSKFYALSPSMVSCYTLLASKTEVKLWVK